MIPLSPKITRLLAIAVQSEHEGEATNALNHARRLFRSNEEEELSVFSMLKELDEFGDSLNKNHRKWVDILLAAYEEYGRLKGKQIDVLNDIWEEVFGDES